MVRSYGGEPPGRRVEGGTHEKEHLKEDKKVRGAKGQTKRG